MEYSRKLQLTGKSTLTISLPKDWIDSLGLKPGDIVKLTVRGSTLVLTPEARESGRKEYVLNVDVSVNAESLLREVISLYLAGYDAIKINFSSPLTHLKFYLKDNVRKKLLGLEVLDETAMSISLQCFAQYVDLPLMEALKKQADLALSMERDAITALLLDDKQLAEEVIQRDDEVDKLFYFITRQLNLAIERPRMLRDLEIGSEMACLSYAAITKSIERIADHAWSIASSSIMIEDKLDDEVKIEIEKLEENVRTIFKESIRILLVKDKNLANKIIEEARRVRDLYNEVFKKIISWKLSPKNASLIKTILEDLVRIADYSTDISEQVIFLTLT
ncbi:MAG: phosphate uptake regulator PhoU [Nitrososphaerota archaeon]